MADNEEINPTSPDDENANNPLNDEQEEALKKIMAELEGQKDEETASDEIGESPPEDQAENDPNGLTNEQEEALKKIMAEIEDTSEAPAETEDSATAITAEQEETLNKIVAELQGDAPQDKEEGQNSENIKKDQTEASASDSASEALSLEQEEALQKIMTEIEEKAPADNDSENIEAKSEPDQTSASSPASEDQGKPSESENENVAISEENKTTDNNFEPLDTSDLESELQKIVSEANTETLQKAESKPQTEPAAANTPEESSAKQASLKDSHDEQQTVISEPAKSTPEESKVNVEEAAKEELETASKIPSDQQPSDPSPQTSADPVVKPQKTEPVLPKLESARPVSTTAPRPIKKNYTKKIALFIGAGTAILFLVSVLPLDQQTPAWPNQRDRFRWQESLLYPRVRVFRLSLFVSLGCVLCLK